MNKRNIFFVLLIVVAALCLVFLNHQRQETTKKNMSENSNVTIGTSNGNSNSVGSAKSFYETGLNYFNNKEYNSAITEFDKAIGKDKLEPNYFSKKAQAQSNLDQTQAAIDTINEGLKYNPSSDLLKTRLDILQRDWIGNQEQ